jgi:hypothetical protein
VIVSVTAGAVVVVVTSKVVEAVSKANLILYIYLLPNMPVTGDGVTVDLGSRSQYYCIKTVL